MSSRSGTTLDTRDITQMAKSTVGAPRMEPRIPTNTRLRKCELAWALSTTENNLPDYFDEVPIFEPHVLQSILVIAETEKKMACTPSFPNSMSVKVGPNVFDLYITASANLFSLSVNFSSK